MGLSEAFAAFGTGHVLFSSFGVGASAVAQLPAADETTGPIASASDKSQRAANLVSKMYQGRGLDLEACTRDITFTDPAVCCSGVLEVAEAFRALRFCRPQQIESSTSGTVDGVVKVHLHQRYFEGSWLKPSGIDVRSLLIVRIADDGRVWSIEEQWNHAPLFEWSPFRWTRRINGLLSSFLTPLLIR